MREADSDDGLDIMLLSASVFVVVFVDTFVTVEVRRGEVVNANAVGHIDAATMATISMSIIFEVRNAYLKCWLPLVVGAL